MQPSAAQLEYEQVAKRAVQRARDALLAAISRDEH